MSKDILKKVASGVRTPVNLKFMTSDDYVTEPLMIFKEEYIEILGHKIDGVDSFEAFVDYLKGVNTYEKERDLLHKERDTLLDEKENFIEYIKVKLEESRLKSSSVPGIDDYKCIEERIYEDILNKIEGDKYE